MEPDLNRYFAESTRLKKANPKLNRVMLETCLHSLFYDDLAALKRSAAITIPVIYDKWLATFREQLIEDAASIKQWPPAVGGRRVELRAGPSFRLPDR